MHLHDVLSRFVRCGVDLVREAAKASVRETLETWADTHA